MGSLSDDQLSAFVAWIAAQKDAAPARLAELLELPASDLASRVAMEPRFRTYSLANHILESSEKTISSNLKLALKMARLARAITVRIDPQTCGGMDALADLGAYALAMEGNVQRVGGRWPAALAAFARAREIQKRGGSDPDLMARIDLLESSLRRDLGQTRKALALIDRAEETFLALKDRERCLWTQVNRANSLIVQEEFDSACALLNEILPTTSNPRIILFIRHNLATTLALAGLSREAGSLLEETREFFYLTASADALAVNRRLWLEGMIARGLGQRDRAERLLREAGTNLAERGYASDAAIVGLELRKLQTRQGVEPVC